MKEEPIEIDVEISGMPDTPLFLNTKINGLARVSIKNYGITFAWIPWVVSQKKVFVTFPGFKRIVNGKIKCCVTISFTNRKFGRFICSAIKSQVSLSLKALEERAQEAKTKKNKEAKIKEKKKKLMELRVFFSLPETSRNEILWDLWERSLRKPKRSQLSQRDTSDWRYHQNEQEEHIRKLRKFETWKIDRENLLRGNFDKLKKMFKNESSKEEG